MIVRQLRLPRAAVHIAALARDMRIPECARALAIAARRQRQQRYGKTGHGLVGMVGTSPGVASKWDLMKDVIIVCTWTIGLLIVIPGAGH